MAVPFIQVDPSSKRLVVTEEARAYLSQVSGTVGVVAVAGVYRTGKSYILNQLAGTTGSGFGVGNSVQAKTKGIWLWGAPLRLAPTPDGGVVVVVGSQSGSKGRGAHVHPRVECVERSVEGRLSKAFRREIRVSAAELGEAIGEREVKRV